MFKRLVIVLVFAFVLGASFSYAQMPDFGNITPEAIKEMEAEPPMSQADIDVYIKILPTLGLAMGSPEEAKQMVKDSGLSETRLGLIMTKISFAQAMAMGMTMEQFSASLNSGQIPEAMKPTEADVALVKNNMDKISAAMIEMQKNIE